MTRVWRALAWALLRVPGVAVLLHAVLVPDSRFRVWLRSPTTQAGIAGTVASVLYMLATGVPWSGMWPELAASLFLMVVRDGAVDRHVVARLAVDVVALAAERDKVAALRRTIEDLRPLADAWRDSEARKAMEAAKAAEAAAASSPHG